MTATEPQYALLVGIDGSITPTPVHQSIIASGELAGNYVRATEPDMPLHVYRHVNLSREGYDELNIAMGVASDVEARIAAEREAVRTELAEARAAARSWETNARASFQDVVLAERAHGTALRTAQAEQHRAQKIIEQARTWKRHALAADAEADTLHAAITSAEMRARVAERDRDIIERKLDAAIMGANRERVMRREAQAQALAAEERISEAQAQALSTIAKIAEALPEQASDAATYPDFEIDTFYSPENIPVIQIDSQLVTGRFRINLNDAPIWDGDPEADDRPGAYLDAAPTSEITQAEIRDVKFVDDGTGRGFISAEVGILGSDSTLGQVAFPAPRQNSKSTISRQLDEIRDMRARVEELEDARNESQQERDAANEACRAYQRQIEELEHANNVERHRHEEREAELQQRIQQHIDSGVQAQRETWEQVREALGLEKGVAVTSAARSLRARFESAQADTQRLERERDELSAECDRAHDMRRKLDQALADEKHAAQSTQAGLRTMIRQRDEVIALALADIEYEGMTAGKFESARRALAPLGDEHDLRADQSVLDGLRATQNVI